MYCYESSATKDERKIMNEILTQFEDDKITAEDAAKELQERITELLLASKMEDN